MAESDFRCYWLGCCHWAITYGNWPTHSWYAAFAPFENPEIVVVAFVYNGGEGAVTAGPVVRQILEAYFELKAVDAATQ